MLSKPLRKPLSKVTLGPYIPNLNGRTAVIVTSSEPCIANGALYDEKMGKLNKPGWPSCDGDHAACFGRTGVATLKSDMLVPAFEDAMIQYLALFELAYDGNTPYLQMRSDVGYLVQKHRTHSGSRRIKAISKDVVSSNPWKIWPEGGGVKYRTKTKKNKDDKEEYVAFYGRELKRLLIAATRKHTSQENGDEPGITLEDIGLNPSKSKPEDWVRGDIPILPNPMRAPQYRGSIKDGCAVGNIHPFTDKYANIIRAIQSGTTGPAGVRTAYLNLIKDGEADTLRSNVFSSNKKAFLRGGMYAKTGGQIGRSVVAPNPEQRPDQVGIPRKLAKSISFRIAVTDENLEDIIQLVQEGHITHILHLKTGEYIAINKYADIKLVPKQMLVLRELQDGDAVLINRQPTLHKNSILGFEVYLHDEDVIYIHPSSTKSFGMDLRTGHRFEVLTVGCLYGYRSTIKGKQCKPYLVRVYNLLVL